MRTFLPGTVFLAAALFNGVASLAPTDEYRDADPQQSSYLPNHNIDPAIVDGPSFGQLWKVNFNRGEQFYAKPLTYTPQAGGPQLLFLASSQNWIRTLDAKTGIIVNAKQVATPFLQSDIGCTDIPGTIGIIGTPIIDPATDIVYFFAKSYIPNYRVPGNTGVSNGVYYFYGVDINTLNNAPGFPLLVDSTVAQNNPKAYFTGGVQLQRPSLTQIGSVVYGAFGGHCDQYNYTGVVMGINVNYPPRIVSQFVTETGPLVVQGQNLLKNGDGGEGGIWMSSMGLASDGNRLFFVTGNGNGHQNQGVPAYGSSGCQTLGEAAVSMFVDSSTGALSLVDYFQPYDYQNMDGGDQDFGSGGIVLLDPGTFYGTGVRKMAVTAGKNGKVYILNADNLGGYMLGTGQTDGILQTIVTNKAIFGAAGSYPLEGGYIYLTPVGCPTYVFQLGFSDTGQPIFSPAGQTNEVSAGRVGVGVPTVTTNKGNPGSAILWMTDPDSGLRAWYAVPQNGILKNIPLPQVNGANKFQRPSFGDGKVYVTDFKGGLTCLGSPVALPLNCTSPINFGQLAIGEESSQTITCKAIIGITKINDATVGDARFVVDKTKLPTRALKAGDSFSFPVTWDLTNTSVQSDPNASYGSVTPGIKTTPLTILITNAVAGYSTQFPISLTGTEISRAPFLVISPSTLDFGGVVILDPSDLPAVTSPFTITNAGLGPMQIVGYGYTQDDLDDDPNFTNATLINGTYDLGLGFTSSALPPVGTIFAGNQAITVQATFYPVNGTGSCASYLEVWTTGGAFNIILEGSASTAPIANISISTIEGGWLPVTSLTPLMDFGSVTPSSSLSRQIRICNQGGSVLTISKSKPPNGIFHISDPAELHESQQIPVGQCASGIVLMNAPIEEYNLPDQMINNTWTLNTDDLNFGVHVVQIQGTVISTKVGPLNSTGQTVYKFLGCWKEGQGVRLFPTQIVNPSTNNSNGYCQSACYSKQYAFAGTEYGTECWCGNTPPPLASQDPTDVFCSTACPADPNDRCGAAGYLSVFYDPIKYIAGADPSAYGPQTVKQVANYGYIGCYSEATTGRALAEFQPQAPATGFTIELCQQACKAFTYFGMEFANECYCGSTINAGSVPQAGTTPGATGCSTPCKGNQNEYCGGGGRLNMYQLNSNISTSRSSSAGATSSASPIFILNSTSSGVASLSASSSSLGSITASGSVSPLPSSTVTSSASSTSSTAPVLSGGPYIGPAQPGWSYLGCYTESQNGRALSDLQNPAGAVPVSVESCAVACSNYEYFGVEYAGECYCGNIINTGSGLATGTTPDQTQCNMICKGNSTEYCGGPSRLNIYGSAPSKAPITVTNLPGYTYLGCYNETNGRTLSALQNPIPSTNNSVETCAKACGAYTYFGVEYGQECYCGNVINAGAGLVAGSTPSQTGCSMVCAANTKEFCGGSNRLNMYKVAPFSSTLSSSTSSDSSISSKSSSFMTSLTISSSATSFTSPSVLSSSSVIFSSSAPPLSSSTLSSSTLSSSDPGPSSPSSSTASSSTASPSSLTLSTLTTSSSSATPSSSDPGSSSPTSTTTSSPTTSPSSPTPSTSSASSSSLATGLLSTPGTSSATNKLTSTSATSSSIPSSFLSTTSSPLALSRSSTRSSTSIISSQTPSKTWIPVPGETRNSWEYLGCANETNPRALNSDAYTNTTGMTVESCQGFCSTNNYCLAGLEFAQECHCGNALQTFSTTGFTGCSMACSGNKSEICGGANRLSVFSLTTYVPPSSPRVVSQYVSLGCYHEATTSRILPGPAYSNTTGMTVESCVNFCQSRNPTQTYAGVEYAQECYCGTALPTMAASAPAASCSMTCKGNNKEFCGGPNYLNLYHYDASAAATMR